MGEQLPREAIDFEAEKELKVLEENIKDIEAVSVDGIITKITPIEMYSYMLTNDKSIPKEKQSTEPNKPSRDVPTLIEYLENASNFIVKAQEEGLVKGARNEITKYFFDSKPMIEELSRLTKEFIALYRSGEDTHQKYSEIAKLSKEIYENVEKVRVIKSKLVRTWERLSGKKWDHIALVVPFPYEPNKAEYKSQYLVDN